MSETDSILADLNPPQREAVTTLAGPLLILAGAGSGKTRVVTRRIAWLVAHGVRPYQILAITFTNKAAGEMRSRVESLVSTPGVWLSTFHSFCARILRREADVLQLSPQFTIYDTGDTESVLKSVLDELKLQGKQFTPSRARAWISKMKADAKDPDQIETLHYETRTLCDVYARYAQVLRKNQALDFDDLLLRAVRLLQEHADVRDRYRDRFQHLLVDEYQDTNACQYELVRLLGGGHRNVCVTGDPDQSIYAWRGADVRNILSFEKDFPDAKVVRLEQNYRSTPQILAVASAVIQHNTERKEKTLWTENPAGPRPELVEVGDEQEEAAEAVRRIQRLVDEGRPYRSIAVFYRTNAQSQPFEQAFVRQGLPYRLIGGVPFYERREVKDALSYLRLLVNPADDVSFRRAISTPRRGIGDTTLEVLAREAAARAVPMMTLAADATWAEESLRAKARAEMRKFLALFDSWRALPGYPVAGLVKQVLKDSGLEDELKAEGEDERLENVEQLVNAAAVHDQEHPPQAAAAGQATPPPAGEDLEPGALDGEAEWLAQQAPLAGFLENAALVQPTDGLGAEGDQITLMTLHMAKGLEFPVVLLAGLEDGLLPLVRTQESAADSGEVEKRAVEEERRLFYVGVTRAQERLCLLRARMRMRYGKTDTARPSRFLGEIPDQLLEGSRRKSSAPTRAASELWDRLEKRAAQIDERLGRRRGGSDGWRAPRRRRPMDDFGEDAAPDENPGESRDADAAESQIEAQPLQEMDIVRHRLHGPGIVLALLEGTPARARVRFRGVRAVELVVPLRDLRRL